MIPCHVAVLSLWKEIFSFSFLQNLSHNRSASFWTGSNKYGSPGPLVNLIVEDRAGWRLMCLILVWVRLSLIDVRVYCTTSLKYCSDWRVRGSFNSRHQTVFAGSYGYLYTGGFPLNGFPKGHSGFNSRCGLGEIPRLVFTNRLRSLSSFRSDVSRFRQTRLVNSLTDIIDARDPFTSGDVSKPV